MSTSQIHRVAILTGGSQGLGLDLTKALVASGWTVVIDARRGEVLTRAVSGIAGEGSVEAIVGDVTDPRHRAALAAAASRHGEVSLVVNNASTLGGSPLPELLALGGESFLRIFDVNVVAPFSLLREVVGNLAPGATVINVTSDAGAEPYAGWGGYGSSKAALEHASRIFALERPDLRVLVVDPGDMRTEMHADAFPGEDISDRPEPRASVPGFMALIEGTQPSGRYLARVLRNRGDEMTADLLPLALDFVIDPDHEAHEPPEARGRRRDDVRLMISVGDAPPIDARFSEFATFLDPGDVLVVNTSATIGAALSASLSDHTPVALHYSGSLPGELSLVEVRAIHGTSTSPLVLERPVTVSIDGGGTAHLLARYRDSERLWIATFELGTDLLTYAARHGRPIRYRHVDHQWPIETYQTVFSLVPGSAEMPSASRPFSHRMVTDLVNHGVTIAPITLHAGVSSLEGGERPYPEWYEVTSETARIVNDARARHRRIIAVGTTVMRALATVTDDHGSVSSGRGWTEVVVTRRTPVRSVSGLLTGWHEPESSHLLMLESIASIPALRLAYRHALDQGYLWHEFGDLHLIFEGRSVR